MQGKCFGINYAPNDVSNGALTLAFGLIGHLRVKMEWPCTHLGEHVLMTLSNADSGRFSHENRKQLNSHTNP